MPLDKRYQRDRIIIELEELHKIKVEVDKDIETLKAELLPYLPGYYPKGTVLVADSADTLDQRWEVADQKASFTDGKWQILPKDNWGVYIHADGSRGPRFCFLTIEYYHPEEVTGKDEKK